MRRNQKLVDVTAEGRAIPALCQLIIQGCCRGIESITLAARSLTRMCPIDLAPAFSVEGALPALKCLCITFDLTPGALTQLAKALAKGTAPQLQELVISNADDLEFEAFADMIEARARLPECKRLEKFGLEYGWCWFDKVWPATQVRLLRALLPSLEKFGTFTWQDAFEPHFLESKAPSLEEFCCRCEHFGTVFSSKVLEAAPALLRVEVGCGNSKIGGAALQAISAALRHGALQNLQELEMRGCHCVYGEVGDFVDALGGSGCTTRLKALSFDGCKVDDDGMRAFADLLSQDGFPALKSLCFTYNWGITDIGAVALANALLKATRTFLTHLILDGMNMGDEGIVALASLVEQDRFKQLKRIDLSRNEHITDRSLILLAKAIGQRGLPMLETFMLEGLDTSKVAAQGAAAIGQVLINGSPKLNRLFMRPVDHENCIYSSVIYNMLLAVGREPRDERTAGSGVLC
jgi:hypothetical protein